MTVEAAVADRFHPDHDRSDPYWNESSWFSWAIPEKKISGFFYYFFRPNMNTFCGGPAMWDPSGAYSWNCLYYDWQLMQPWPKGAEKYNFTAPNSTSVRIIEPMKQYHLGYDRPGFKLDLTWSAVAAAHEFRMGDGGTGQAGRFHFEQPGRVRGTVTRYGETHTVDCFSIRDGSHGSRSMGAIPRGSYLWSIASATSGFHAIVTEDGPTMRVVGGYLLRDGRMASLKGGVRRVVERAGPRPQVIAFEAEDTLGRRLQAIGRVQNCFEWQGYQDQAIWWSLVAWEYDGHADAVGEDQEYYNLQDFSRWVRGEAEPWSSR